jgi:hypothetical protein
MSSRPDIGYAEFFAFSGLCHLLRFIPVTHFGANLPPLGAPMLNLTSVSSVNVRGNSSYVRWPDLTRSSLIFPFV